MRLAVTLLRTLILEHWPHGFDVLLQPQRVVTTRELFRQVRQLTRTMHRLDIYASGSGTPFLPLLSDVPGAQQLSPKAHTKMVTAPSISVKPFGTIICLRPDAEARLVG